VRVCGFSDRDSVELLRVSRSANEMTESNNVAHSIRDWSVNSGTYRRRNKTADSTKTLLSYYSPLRLSAMLSRE